MRAFIKELINSKWFKYILLAYGILSFISIIVFGDILLTMGYRDESKVKFLNDNWNITINEKEYKDISLDEFSFDTVTMNDTVEMRTTLPEDWKYKDAVMCFHTRQATVDMYIDDELVYQYGHKRKENGQTVGSGLLFINMPSEYKGKDIRIMLEVSEKQAFSRLDEVWISEWEDSYKYIITKNRFAMFFGFFFVVFGIITVSVAGVAAAFDKRYFSIVFLAVFCICIGLWSLCYYHCVIIFSLPLYSITLMEYMSLLLAPIPIIAYMWAHVKELDLKRYKTAYKIIFIVQIMFTNTFITLHGTDILHAAAILPYFHVLILIELVFFVKVIIKSMRRKSKFKMLSKGIYIGPILAITFITYELIIYLVNRYAGYELPRIDALSSMGIMTFLIVLLKDYWNKATQNMMEKQENEMLKKRAYTDGLTAMNNRRYCSEYMAKILEEHKEFTVISFDLNGLKRTNDIYGHIKGDLLIKQAAKVITDSFGKAGVVGRMGGDEFIAILTAVNNMELDELINRFHNAIAEVNSNDRELNLSIAFGYASSNEIENCDNFERIFNIADKRMYVNKRNTKKK